MGLLSELVNRATGWTADVTVDAPSAECGTTTTITGTVQVKDEPITTKGVTIEIRTQREVRGVDTNLRDGIPAQDTYVYGNGQEVVVAGPQVLEATSSHTFTATFEMPNGKPSDRRTDWQARTVVQSDGNNPDSGWVVFDVDT